MSGGVDSSVAALLLKQQGYSVIGFFMRNWEEKDSEGNCQNAADYEDVKAVCRTLDIPYYTLDFVKEYRQLVFDQFINDFAKGWTPNPDILCNKEIKFKVFFDKAMQLGANFLATGHYAQIDKDFNLIKAADESKDQTYFLHAMPAAALAKVMFPIGHLQKSEVRQIAREHNLITHQKKDSTGICFIGERNFKNFLNNYIQKEPGDFITTEGKVVGKHDGLSFYTIGQRRGLAIGGPGEAWFVAGKNLEKNQVLVVQGQNHPALFYHELTASSPTWLSENLLADLLQRGLAFECTAKIRYRQTDVKCIVYKLDHDNFQDNFQENFRVRFKDPVRAVTTGQYIVFYLNEICLGGAVITST